MGLYFLKELFYSIADAFSALRFSFFAKKLSMADRRILQNHFPYYARMNPKFKPEFERKLERMISSKEFIGRGGIDEVTQEMELLIGATLTMVLFGWKGIQLPHFNRILIYPNAYYSTVTKTYHRGEVNPKFGLIVVSWRCFLEGLVDESDGVNLGIHEIAHALKLENLISRNDEYGFLDPNTKRQYRAHMQEEMKQMKAGKFSPFRSNAMIDEDEFFAVVLEYFFEKPQSFQKHRPDFYQTLVHLLRQNPLVVSPPTETSLST
ncbi:zinc-dependent peptidase [Algoriphagus namhaensis]|uniref:Zinc-dependent peptidase n=1 Tax=Algoriphagus namhaensis TaxID=915353 RepID=A0ABV8AP23_9BACT